MTSVRLEVALLILTTSLGGLAWHRWNQSVVAMTVPAPVSPPVRNELRPFGAASLDSAADFLTSYDVFRLAGEPAGVRYDGVGGNRGAPPTPDRPQVDRYRPALVLRGISGPPWMALIEGIPGKPGATLVRADAAVDRLRIKSITRDTVFIEGPDTTWALTIKRGRS